MASVSSTLVTYLGRPASVMLASAPFNSWAVTRSIDDDLQEPIIVYAFPQNGLELLCDAHDQVCTVFLYSDGFGGYGEGLLDVPFASSRQQVQARLGRPSRSGNPHHDPILGEYGPWDRYDRALYTLHIEYAADADRVRMITLMRPDVVP